MRTQTVPRTISLSAELAHSDDARHHFAMRWRAALHRLSMIRATANDTTYEIEWARIFETETLISDLRRSKLVCFAALDVLEIQHDLCLTVCRADGIAYDEEVAEEYRELLAAFRYKVENDLA